MEYTTAAEWAVKNLDADEYQAEVGEDSEGDDRTVLTISIDSATAGKIRKMAQENGMSISSLIASKF